MNGNYLIPDVKCDVAGGGYLSMLGTHLNLGSKSGDFI